MSSKTYWGDLYPFSQIFDSRYLIYRGGEIKIERGDGGEREGQERFDFEVAIPIFYETKPLFDLRH